MVRFTTVLIAALAGAVSAVGMGRDPGPPMAIRAAPDKPMEGLDSNCNKWHRVVKGDTCEAIARQTSINLEDFLKWNTKITKACKELWADFDVCIGVSGAPSASGTNSPTSKPPAGSSPPAPASPAGSSPPVPASPAGSSPPAPASPAGSSPLAPASPAGSSPPAPASPAGSCPPAPNSAAGSSPPVPASPAGSSPPAANPSTASSNGAQPSCKG